MRLSCQIRRCFSPMCAPTRFHNVLPRLYPSYSALKYCCVMYLSLDCPSSRPRSVSVSCLLLGLALPCVLSRIVTHRDLTFRRWRNIFYSGSIATLKTYGTKSRKNVHLRQRRCELCMRTHTDDLSGDKEANGTVVRNVCTLAHNARVFRYPHTWIRPRPLLL
jgi:hypothetical protein